MIFHKKISISEWRPMIRNISFAMQKLLTGNNTILYTYWAHDFTYFVIHSAISNRHANVWNEWKSLTTQLNIVVSLLYCILFTWLAFKKFLSIFKHLLLFHCLSVYLVYIKMNKLLLVLLLYRTFIHIYFCVIKFIEQLVISFDVWMKSTIHKHWTAITINKLGFSIVFFVFDLWLSFYDNWFELCVKYRFMDGVNMTKTHKKNSLQVFLFLLSVLLNTEFVVWISHFISFIQYSMKYNFSLYLIREYSWNG